MSSGSPSLHAPEVLYHLRLQLLKHLLQQQPKLQLVARAPTKNFLTLCTATAIPAVKSSASKR